MVSARNHSRFLNSSLESGAGAVTPLPSPPAPLLIHLWMHPNPGGGSAGPSDREVLCAMCPSRLEEPTAISADDRPLGNALCQTEEACDYSDPHRGPGRARGYGSHEDHRIGGCEGGPGPAASAPALGRRAKRTPPERSRKAYSSCSLPSVRMATGNSCSSL